MDNLKEINVINFKNIANLKYITFIILIISYLVIFYCILHWKFKIDFTSLYFASNAFIKHQNPYQEFLVSIASQIKKLPVNLNPPILLLLISPFASLSYLTALKIWIVISFALGVLGAFISFKIIFQRERVLENVFFYFCIYLLSYGFLINTSITQMGGILLFFLISGYYFFLRKKIVSSAFFWSVAISIKLFPGLILLFLVVKKAYREFILTFSFTLLILLLPAWIYGIEVYIHYFYILKKVFWYGANWNASVYGFLYRFFKHENLSVVILYFVFSVALIVCYCLQLKNIFIKTLKNTHNHSQELKHLSTHLGFSLTLILMLMLSPFGWIYYVPILIFPFLLAFKYLSHYTQSKYKVIFYSSFILLNFPLIYLNTDQMSSITSKLTINSVYFYGLSLLLYLFFFIQAEEFPDIRERPEFKKL